VQFGKEKDEVKRRTVFVEKFPVLNVKDTLAEIISAFGLFYILNYEYCPHIAKALQFWQIHKFLLDTIFFCF